METACNRNAMQARDKNLPSFGEACPTRRIFFVHYRTDTGDRIRPMDLAGPVIFAGRISELEKLIENIVGRLRLRKVRIQPECDHQQTTGFLFVAELPIHHTQLVLEAGVLRVLLGAFL